MTLTNHLLTGAVLAKFLPAPVAIPLAFASHFLLDALPHFGYKTIEERLQHSSTFRAVIVVDVVCSIAITAWLVKTGNYLWLLSGLVSFSPDLLWVYRFTVEEKFGKVTPTQGNRFVVFHRNIQKYERSWGIVVELVYGIAAFMLLK